MNIDIKVINNYILNNKVKQTPYCDDTALNKIFIKNCKLKVHNGIVDFSKNSYKNYKHSIVSAHIKKNTLIFLLPLSKIDIKKSLVFWSSSFISVFHSRIESLFCMSRS